jgi:ABC-type amino acid transport substrate-binding protein
MSGLIFASLAVFAAYVLAWCLHHLKKKFPAIRLPSIVVRVGTWTDELIRHEGEKKTATFGDLVLFVTLWVIAFTLWFTFSQISGERYKEELDKANTKAVSLEGKLNDQEQHLQEMRQKLRFPVPELPRADDQIIGNHVDLKWESSVADSGQDYVIEVTMITGKSERMPIGIPCLYPATESLAQRSRFQATPKDPVESGTYIWRIGVGNLHRASGTGDNRNPQEAPCPQDDRIRTWSDYSKFTVYRTQKERLMDTGEVLVGTTFQLGPFSALGSDGKPAGFEMDLIQAIIQECIVRRIDKDANAAIVYDNTGCKRRIDEDISRFTLGDSKRSEGSERPRTVLCETGDCPLHARIIELRLDDNWQTKLRDRNLDLYLGTLTRAKSREKGDVRFTSGYLAYDSELLTNNEEGDRGLEILKENKTVGVLENSTNQWLADELHKDFPKLSIRQFSSLAALEGAFEQKEIDLVVVDDILQWSKRRKDLVVKGLQKSNAWTRYMRLLGYPAEKFGIAVADDVKDEENRKDELRHALNEALNGKPIQELIDYLYHYYDLEEYGAKRCQLTTDPCREDRTAVRNPD